MLETKTVGHVAATLSAGRPIVASARDLTKTYELHRSDGARFLRQLLGRFSPVVPRVFPALQGVSFDLRAGEALAVLGRNGAGKSTMLQLVAGVLKPSSGTLNLPPRVLGLLELGSGFNHDFTGRENIALNAAILGLGRAELRDKIDDIIAFADIGDYIDQPVRTYSSGMFLRLAFGIATSVEPELLLIDEVLAVGDIFFRQKCYDRLKELRAGGTAVVLVTHSIGDAAEFCEQGLVLSEGRVAFQGRSTDAVEYYVANEHEARTGKRGGERPKPAGETPDLAVHDGSWFDAPGAVDLTGAFQIGNDARARIERIIVTDTDGHPRTTFEQGDWMRVRAAVRANAEMETALVGLLIRNDKNVAVHGKNSINVEGEGLLNLPEGALIEMAYDVRLDIEAGEYTIELAVADMASATWNRRESLTATEIHADLDLLRRITAAAQIMIIPPLRRSPSTISHYGIADLPGRFSAVAYAPEDPSAQHQSLNGDANPIIGSNP